MYHALYYWKTMNFDHTKYLWVFKHFIVKVIHKNYKILRLLRWLKL